MTPSSSKRSNEPGRRGLVGWARVSAFTPVFSSVHVTRLPSETSAGGSLSRASVSIQENEGDGTFTLDAIQREVGQKVSLALKDGCNAAVSIQGGA